MTKEICEWDVECGKDGYLCSECEPKNHSPVCNATDTESGVSGETISSGSDNHSPQLRRAEVDNSSESHSPNVTDEDKEPDDSRSERNLFERSSGSKEPVETETIVNRNNSGSDDESLSDKKLTLYRDMNGLTCPTGVFRNEDVKEKIQNAQRRLKEVILNLPAKMFYNRRVVEEINKIFLEEFGKG